MREREEKKKKGRKIENQELKMKNFINFEERLK